jgi:hypothetical protein
MIRVPPVPALLAATLASLGLPRPATAQFPRIIDKFFDNVKQIDLFVENGWLVSSDHAVTTADFLLKPPLGGLRGWGVEVLVDLADSTRRQTRKHAARHSDWELSLGLGYGYTTGFLSREPTLDLRGSVRSLPTVAFYASPPHWPLYFGASVGLTELWNVKGYDPSGVQYGVSAESFELGWVAGLEQEAGFLAGLLIEAGYHVRDFRSLEWRLLGSPVTLPANWPRSLDLSAFTVSLGYHLKLR